MTCLLTCGSIVSHNKSLLLVDHDVTVIAHKARTSDLEKFKDCILSTALPCLQVALVYYTFTLAQELRYKTLTNTFTLHLKLGKYIANTASAKPYVLQQRAANPT